MNRATQIAVESSVQLIFLNRSDLLVYCTTNFIPTLCHIKLCLRKNHYRKLNCLEPGVALFGQNVVSVTSKIRNTVLSISIKTIIAILIRYG